MYFSKSNQEIISLLRQNNVRAFEMLYDQYGSILFGVALRLSVNNEDAEVLLRKTFIQIKKNCTAFDESKQNFLLWMIGILRKTASCHYASSENRSHSFYVGEGVDDPFHIENKSVMPNPSPEKILDLIFFGGKKINEVAKQFGMNEQTVRQLLREAISQYRKEPTHTKWT